MWYTTGLIPFATFIAALVLLVQASDLPPCLADCVKNATNPCDQDSLGWLFSCLNDECLDTASANELTLDPKAEYSCQDSLIPGTQDTFSSVTLLGDASCVTNPYEFKSFIPSTPSTSLMDMAAQRCELMLFPAANCTGDAANIEVITLQETKCMFHGGRSAKLSCSDPPQGLNAYQYLEQMCANTTSTSIHGVSPTAYGSASVANTTVHTPSMYPHVTGSVITAYATPSDQAKTSSSPGLAGNEQARKPSVVALVAVLAAAIVVI